MNSWVPVVTTAHDDTDASFLGMIEGFVAFRSYIRYSENLND